MRMLSAVPALPVRDLARSLAFYRDVLGFTVAHRDAGFAVLRSDTVQLHLWVAADEDWRSRGGEEPVVSGAESFIAGTASCQVQVDDADDLYTRLKAQGAMRPDAQVTDEPWGTRDFHVVDPDNNLITFFERRAAAEPVPSGARPSERPPDHAEPDDSADL